MKRLLIIVLACAVLAFLGNRVRVYFTAHDTRILWMLQSLETAFNDSAAGPIGDALADDFVEERSNFDRRRVILVLMQYFHRTRAGGEFPYRCELPPKDEITIEVDADADPPTARVAVKIRFVRLGPEPGPEDERGETGRETTNVGTLAFEGDLEYEDGEWLFKRARQEIVEGRAPF